MALSVTTNVASISAQGMMDKSTRGMEKSFAQLASGSRITKAADDAAGLSISESLKSTIRGYQQAKRNANNGISMVQVAEGGLGEVSNILTRLRELGVQAASDTNGVDEREFINKEVQQLKSEIQRIAETTRFGGTRLLDGSGETFEFQIDINNDEFQDRIKFDSSELIATTAELDVDSFDFSDKENARDALNVLEASQKKVNGYRANLGAIQNRLISTDNNLATAIENFSAANSRVRDTDVAESSSELARNQVLQQASIAVLAQANQAPSAALRLIS